MKLNPSALGIATASAVAILWVICSVIVVFLPSMAMNMSGSMLHTDFSGMQWSMNLTGFIIGLVTWSVFSGILAWLLAVIYNRLN